MDLLRTHKKNNKSIILLLGHYSSWEGMLTIGNHLDFPSYAIYTPLTNKYFNKLIFKSRQRHNSTAIDRYQIIKVIKQNLNLNKIGIYGFAMDQSPNPRKTTYWRSFMGKDTPVFNGAEIISKKYDLPVDAYILGSFQRDTEGSDLKSPKLIKGPDRLVKIIKSKSEESDKLIVLLSGKRRQYVIKELENSNIDYRYFEMVDTTVLNELYNCLDLYIVSSRLEGGPQAIIECGLSKTPIISTNVGVASEFLHSSSLFDMDNFQNAIPNTEYAYEKSKQYAIPNGFKEYLDMFNSIKFKDNA